MKSLLDNCMSTTSLCSELIVVGDRILTIDSSAGFASIDNSILLQTDTLHAHVCRSRHVMILELVPVTLCLRQHLLLSILVGMFPFNPHLVLHHIVLQSPSITHH